MFTILEVLSPNDLISQLINYSNKLHQQKIKYNRRTTYPIGDENTRGGKQSFKTITQYGKPDN